MFNSLKYAKQLEKAGVSRDHAEAHLQILSEVMESNLATQQNLKDLENAIKHDLVLLRNDVVQLKNDIVQSEQRMTIKLGTIISIAIGVAVAVVKLV